MKTIILFITVILLAGCGDTRKVENNPGKYTEYKAGDVLAAQIDMEIWEYNYLDIPLVKPGIQLIVNDADEKYVSENKVKFTGKVNKGDLVEVYGFVIEGGWIPCHGNRYYANPMAIVRSGPSKGRKVGISLISRVDSDKAVQFEKGTMCYLKCEETFLKYVNNK